MRIISIAFLITVLVIIGNINNSLADLTNDVGRKATQKYFVRSPDQNADFQSLNLNPRSDKQFRPFGFEVLQLYIGSIVSSSSYFWGSSHQENIAKWHYGFSYLFDQWYGMDRHIRLEMTEYVLQEGTPRKLTFIPIITFPRAETRFPLYFGFGLGFSLLFGQLKGESEIGLDYQLLAGLRFLDVFDSVGFFVEVASKNNVFLTSDGQFMGTSLVTGAVFTF